MKRTRSGWHMIPNFLLPLAVISSLSLPGKGQIPRFDPQLGKLIQMVRAEDNPNEAMDFMLRIHSTDQWFNFLKFQETAAYLEKTMKTIGLQNVEVTRLPADGVTQYGWWTMPLAWDVKRAKLEVVEPAVPPGMRLLADYRQIPASLIMWSGPTPPGGVISDVVELNPNQLEALHGLDVKGKMVLTKLPMDLGRRGALKAGLYKMGAAGIISDTTEHPALIKAHYWVNAWGDDGWAFTKTSSPLVGFSITPRQGAYLRSLLARHERVRVRAIVDSRYYSGTYPYVTGIIKGRSSDEEVLELGHTSETGAQDNATGVAANLESMALLNRLIESGRLPHPFRSIRILAMPEKYGSMAYIITHPERVRRTIGAINLDTPAGPYDEAGTEYTVLVNPAEARSYQDALMVRVAESYYASIPGRFPHWAPYRPASDTYLSDPLIGIPTVALKGGWGTIDAHHSSADTVNRVDPRSLRDLSSMVAAYAYYLAAASDAQIPWLAAITVNRGYNDIVRATDPSVERMAAAANAGTLANELYSGLEETSYSAGRTRAAILSTLRLASPEQRAEDADSLKPALTSLQKFIDSQENRLRQLANQRASELGAVVPIKPVAPAPNPSLAWASRIIVKRKRPGPVTLDDLPFGEREGYPGFGENPPPMILLNWCDGRRTLAEVIRRIELEHGPMNFNFVGYFKFLARHGYLVLLPEKK